MNGNIRFSLTLLVIGVILFWVVEATVAGTDLKVVGVVLLVAGVVDLVLSLLFLLWGRFVPPAHRPAVVAAVETPDAIDPF